ncbi:DUF993 family protein [Caballeronia sp. EK]|uniref:DUF993 family protein n=1 Tax=Caballeronia sp. EK TaxID=2767469 RepID=UPI00281620CC|nr:DUF993 family protein [Caballeronia sp. EK]
MGGAPAGATFNRIAYSAAHVVADPHRSGELNQPAALDWPRTIEYRRYLDRAGPRHCRSDGLSPSQCRITGCSHIASTSR